MYTSKERGISVSARVADSDAGTINWIGIPKYWFDRTDRPLFCKNSLCNEVTLTPGRYVSANTPPLYAPLLFGVLICWYELGRSPR